MLFENLSGLTLLSETDALVVNGGRKAGGEQSQSGNSNSVRQLGLININVEGDRDCVTVSIGFGLVG